MGTDRAYKNLMSGGGQAPDNGQKVADALDGLYAQVNASGLNKAQKTRAIALLETLKLYGDTEYIRKTLLGIQMAGGAEKFFTTLSVPSGYALIDMQKKERQALQTRLAQTERAIADIPLWNRWVSPTPDYQELQREKAGLQEQIGAVEARLSELSPDWETVWDIWDWSEVDAWEKEQEETAQRAENEAYRKQLESLVYPDALSLPETLQSRFADIAAAPQNVGGLEEMWNLPLSEIIARLIIGEAGDRRVSDQDRIDICYSIIVRILDDQRFRGAVVKKDGGLDIP